MTGKRFQQSLCCVLLVVAMALWLSFLMGACGRKANRDNSDGSNAAEDSTTVAAAFDSVVIQLTGLDSLTVFDLLQQEHEVDYRSSAMGAFVTAIDSVENGGGAYWVYSVNDSMPKVASDKYVTRDGDIVKWHFRKRNH